MNIPNTYYVLDNVSTCPITVPLKDYSRKRALTHPAEGSFEQIANNIEKNWKCIQQKIGKDNEKITIFYNPDEWKC
jgi:hypothetical protein